jgi:hypothetical protein
MQTKKRAKPVKFGKAAKDQEKKTEVAVEAEPSEEATPAQPAQPEQPAVEPQTPAPAAKQESELVDKLSDVPFETDFGVPSTNAGPTTPTVPTDPVQPAGEPQSPAATPLTEVQPPQDVVRSDNIQSVPSAFDTSPTAPSGSSIPPIGRANEPIPFSPHETVFNTPPDGGEKKRNPFLYFIVIALVAFVTGIAFMAGIYYAMPNKNFFAMFSMPNLSSIPGIPQATPTTAPVAKAVPTVTPPAKKLSDYSVKVLNGSGVSGQAAKVKASLTAEGFTVSSTGNADSSDVQKTQITYKKTVSDDVLTKVKDTLKKTYVLDKETKLPDAAASKDDITITIGKLTSK